MALPYDNIAFLFGALIASGGIAGFARARSIPSLVAGCGVGALYGYGGFRIRNGQPYGLHVALLASLALAGSSIPRAIKTGKPLTQGLSAAAVTGLAMFGYGLYSKKVE
ncbi:transmembrane proteins 14C-domain-containing protein [Lineolata rhizophorae]|uniref:Transmembrane proteins 14C-domain-containing protein n=1 Tax=Lineolata rhizophorae TaxID=578093 RepID=A0A6A6P809_9PEZI|nr:transmembrane proteins 14C-domain-containing protein [Lineolata rhizophorae]